MSTFLFNALQTGSTVLTPNQRLAATLLKQYNRAQLKLGLTAWLTPALRPLLGWIQELWNHYSAQAMDSSYLPLSANQELILWEALLAARPESEQLLKLSELAKQAKAAWSTLKLWRTDFHHPAFSFTENCRYFQAWAEQFQAVCFEKQWLDSASLIELLIEKIRQGKIPLPPRLILLNFTEVAPLYQELLAACEQQGLAIERHQHPNQATPQSFQLGLANQETEIQVMARWAKKTLEDHPQASIGCIVSQLEEKRDAIISIFNELFAGPESYNISAGKTLASYPIIQQALELLKLSPQSVSFATLSAMLHSPFIGDAEKERFKRLQWDSQLRRRNITTSQWIDLLADKQMAFCGNLAARIHAYLDQRKMEASSQSISCWLLHFAQLLETLGWPGEQSLTSAEYQVVKSWLGLLREATTLDHILDPLSYHQALHYLTVLATQTYFQPESPDAPIQILGQLEGAGLPFDYLWVMGLDDTAWPPLPSPNPLIPHELQKSLNMPNATADRQLEYSLGLTEQFQKAATLVIFSYSLHTEKEELRPSPLITHFKTINLTELKLPPFKSSLKILFETQALEQLEDEEARPLAAQEKLSGGVSLFELQAACPFKAFAKLRLGARTLEETQSGLPAKNRGNIIHKVLELFWREIKDQKTLAQLAPQQLQIKIHHLLTVALKELAPFIHKDSFYNALVTQRLEALLLSWLELEKNRPPFQVIAIEEEQAIKIEEYFLTLRIDRIDELAEGEKLIIDYKTKKVCDTQDWFSKRPEEPQLPLYCLSNQGKVVGLAFAQLHTGKIELKGVAQKDLGLDNIKTLTEKTKADATSWEEQLQQWRLNLIQLFHDFQSGKAAVDPKNPPETCRYCDLQALCRIHENRLFSYD